MVFERIRALREDHDLRQQDLAKLLNCTQVTYSRYELGQRDIPIEALMILASYYHTSLDYLVGLSDCKTPPDKK